ncbi:MAG: hypothetical protein K1060chlam5_01264 [Candidatus Anoxychlamydiales bacterium]|nr:hypothetical protein [Candidatus Anoxychlamydiales bacterium]
MSVAVQVKDAQNNLASKDKEIKTAWLKASNFLKSSTKDVFKVMELSGEYAKITFEDIDELFPVTNLIKLVKQAYSTLVWQDIAVSTTKWFHQATVFSFKRDEKSAKEFARATMGSMWDIQKIAKWVDKFKIIAVSSVFLTRISILGGASYFAKSAERAYLEGYEIYKLDPNKQKNKLHHQIIKVINNIAKSLIGAIVIANAAFSFIAPMPLLLMIGTTIIGTNILNGFYKKD